MEPLFSKEQLVDAMKAYYKEARENPDDFKINLAEYTDEEAVKAVDFLLSKIK